MSPCKREVKESSAATDEQRSGHVSKNKFTLTFITLSNRDQQTLFLYLFFTIWFFTHLLPPVTLICNLLRIPQNFALLKIESEKKYFTAETAVSWIMPMICDGDLCLCGPPCSVPKWKNANKPTGPAVLWKPSSERASGCFVNLFSSLLLNKGGPVKNPSPPLLGWVDLWPPLG